MDTAKNRRRSLRIKNEFQNRFILESILVTFIFINTVIIVSFFALESTQDFYRLRLTLAVALATCELGGLAIVYFYSLKTSHRIAGPIFMLEKGFKAIGDGNLSFHFKLRTGDYLMDTVNLYNESITQLRGKIDPIKRTAEELRKVVNNDQRAALLIAQLIKELNAINTEVKSDPVPAQTIADAIAEDEMTAPAT